MKLDFRRCYWTQVTSELHVLRSYRNSEQVPKILKICLNKGVGEAAKNNRLLEITSQELALITGQKPHTNKAKKSVAGFKIRDGMNIGGSVTLRRIRMYAFLEKFIHIVLPRVRDFKGVSFCGFDGQGNYNFGIRDKLVFPELPYENLSSNRGFNLSIVTNANTNEESYALLHSFGMPFTDLYLKHT